MKLIPDILSSITRYEGSKFLHLKSDGGNALVESLQTDKTMPSLYVHIPFCRRLCPFCCFNRYLFKEDLARSYFGDLKTELDLYLRRGFTFTNIYFGGGTPTILMDELHEFIVYLRECLNVKEISLETTPAELSEENIASLKAAGINRLSIGIQSFDDDVLKTMGRYNGPADEVKRRLLLAQGQFDTLNVDFVFNFPGQTIDQFAGDVAVFKELELDQATFYPLMASPHKKDALERKFNDVDFSREQRFYNVVLQELYHGGYTTSTAWCFSRGKRMIDEYIIEFDDYVGIGAGSVSIVQGNFYVNSFALSRYHELINKGSFPVIGWRRLTEKENLRYYLLTKLFGGKLDREKMHMRFGNDAGRRLWLELAFLKTAGLVRGDNMLEVTEKGMYSVSVMMRDFFASLNTLRERCIEEQV